jgi:hypothetical protein
MKKVDQKGFAHVLLALFVLIALAAVGFMGYKVISKHSSVGKGSKSSDAMASDSVTKGKYLSNNQCTGSGSKELTSAPMRANDIGVIYPMGNMVQGGHVTPIDHQYYYQKNPNAAADTYDVLAPADGDIVDVQYRTQNVGDQNRDGNSDPVNQYRIVISYSCTFFSYYDLMTSLDQSVTSKDPGAAKGKLSKPIHVTAGQVIGHVGGESLDFAVWDTTKTAKGLLFPIAYSGEAWKINTVAPLDYFSSSVKKHIIPYYVRATEPVDGKFDYDQSGKAVGNWFKTGTNGYAGSSDGRPTPDYYRGHLAIAYDAVDPDSVIFSIGDFQGNAQPFAVKDNGPNPSTIGVSDAPTKYELISLSYSVNGQGWNGMTPAKNVTVMHSGQVKGIALIQLTDTNDMKVEVFPGKTASQVSGFDGNAQVYNRGQDARTVGH